MLVWSYIIPIIEQAIINITISEDVTLLPAPFPLGLGEGLGDGVGKEGPTMDSL